MLRLLRKNKETASPCNTEKLREESKNIPSNDSYQKNQNKESSLSGDDINAINELSVLIQSSSNTNNASGIVSIHVISLLQHHLDNLKNGSPNSNKNKKFSSNERKLVSLEEEYLNTVRSRDEAEVELVMNSDEDVLQTTDGHNKMHMIAIEKQKIQKKLIEQKKQRNTNFYCKGEIEALKKQEMKKYVLQKTNVFDCDAESIHFRIVQSQIARGSASMIVEEVEYIVNPKLLAKFNQCKIDLANRHGFLVESMKPLLLFHGSSPDALDSIAKNNFLLERISSNTGNFGYYGKGFYFSEMSHYSCGYCKGGQWMLMCLVLVGKAHKLDTIVMGCPKQEGYDSHVSPDGSSEVVIFDPNQILPLYKFRFAQRTSNSYE